MRSLRATAPENLERLEDAELARLARQRQGEAFRLIMQRNNPRLYRVARSLLDDDAEAEDVVQRSTSLPSTSWRNFAPKPVLPRGSHALPSTKRWGGCAADGPASSCRFSTRLPEPTPTLIPFPQMPTHTDPERGAALKQIRQLIEQAIDELPDGFRAVFVMRDIEAMSVAETADVLALSPATVKTRLYRARRLRTPGAGCPAGLGIARHFSLRRRSLSTNDGNGAGQARPATRPRRLRPTAGGEHDRRRTTSGKGSMPQHVSAGAASAPRLYAKGIVMPGDRCSSWCGPWVFDFRRPPQKRHLHAAVAQHRHGEAARKPPSQPAHPLPRPSPRRRVVRRRQAMRKGSLNAAQG